MTGVGRRRSIGAGRALGGVRGLVISHCESVDSSILDATVDSWDRHFAVNARAAWLLIKAFAEHLTAEPTTEVRGRIVALTSDHAVHNLPCGASKGALDRAVLAAAVELASRGIRANVINPGTLRPNASHHRSHRTRARHQTGRQAR